jgi:hypothetical protein
MKWQWCASRHADTGQVLDDTLRRVVISIWWVKRVRVFMPGRPVVGPNSDSLPSWFGQGAGVP